MSLRPHYAHAHFISVAVFMGSFVVITIACTSTWEVFVKNHIYNCTDDLPLDYLQPGQWVHNPVAVRHVVSGRSMSEPDTIKEGWSVWRLWLLWSSSVAGSLIVSFLLARLPLRRERTTEQQCEHTKAV